MNVGLTMRNLTRLSVPDARTYLLEGAQTAEALGFYSCWVSDHIFPPTTSSSKYPYHSDGRWDNGEGTAIWESLSVLSAISVATSDIRLGVSALVLPLRHAVYAAKVLATIDCLSDGRLIVAAGVGWLREEMEMLGSPTFEERGALADEQLEVFKTLWTSAEPTFAGRWYEFSGGEFLPKPVQHPHPPIWVAGTSTPALRRVIRHGDGWHAVSLSPRELRQHLMTLSEMANVANRDPNSITSSTTHTVIIDTQSTGKGAADTGFVPQAGMVSICGNPDQIAWTLRDYARAGLDHFTAYYRLEDGDGSVNDALRAIEIMGSEVLPQV